MNLLFVHDHRFRKVGDELYSTGGLNDEVLGRYTVFCDYVTVVARIQEEESANGQWSMITNKKVKILGTGSLSYDGLKDEVMKCDKMIVRLPSVLGLKALEINKKIGKPYLIELVGCPWDSLWNHGIVEKMVAPYFYFRNKSEVKMAPYVLYVTNEFLQRRYPTEGKQIGCSDVVLQETDKSVLQKRLEKINANDGKKIIIGTTAAVNVRYKGQQYVIEALGYLKKLGIVNYEYQLAGNGDPSFLKEAAKMYDVEDQVKFLGGVSHDQVFDWLDSLDLYVQPSRQEGLPRALVEAMSRGLPAFGARTGGIPELLDDDFIFSNTGSNIREIADIVMEFSKDRMLEQARRNFDKAGEFQQEKLDKKRNEFYRAFFEN